MKLFFASVILISLSVAIQSAPTEDEMKALAMSCKAETGASDVDLENVVEHQSTGTEEGKCLLACIVTNLGMMTDGKMNFDAALKVVSKHAEGDAEKLSVIEEIFEACKDITPPENKCDAAENYSVCLRNEANKRGITNYDF